MCPQWNTTGNTGPAGLTVRGLWTQAAVNAAPANRGDLWRRGNAVYSCNANGVTTDPLVDGANWSVFLLDGAPASLAPRLVRMGGNKSSGAGATTLTITVPFAGHAAGNLLVIPVFVGFSGSASTVPVTITGVADNHAGSTNVYTVEDPAGDVTTVGTGQLRMALVWCKLTTALVAGDVITVTFSAATSSDLIIDSAEFTNITARDAAAVAAVTTGTVISAPPLTPTTSTDLVVFASSATPVSYPAPLTGLNALAVSGGVTRGFSWAHGVLSGTAPYTASETISPSQTQVATAMLFR